MDTTYSAKQIEVLEGLEAVRVRPGMYIGTTGAKGLHHILWEIVDNAVDEAANGYATKISVEILEDNSVSVLDNGRGIPVDIHPQLGVSAVEVVFTRLHAGGKFNNSNYAYSGGLHGVGASVTNALSERLCVEVYKNGRVYRQNFHSYLNEKTNKIVSGAPVSPLIDTGEKTLRCGTRVTFLPDTRVFGNVAMSLETVAKRIRELAYLNKKIEFTLIDRRAEYEEVFMYEGGIGDYVVSLNENKQPIFSPPLYSTGENDILKLEFALQYTNTFTENIFSYVNNVPTPEGGTHETGFKSALTRAMNDYARKENLLKEKDENLLGEDFREGLTAILLVKMANVQFEGQTKSKLGNIEAKSAVENICIEAIGKLLDSNSQKAALIIKKAIGAAEVRNAARKAKDLARQKNSIANAHLIGKLASCTGRDHKKNELFIVEGDSAGGSARKARDRTFQAILPLRGKPLNCERSRIDKVLANEEIRTIIAALDTGFGEDFDIEALRYDKIIILSDADQDGAHIRAILLTFFFRYMRSLLAEGHIYIGMPPLYKVSKKDKVAYAYDDAELEIVAAEFGRSPTLQRYKGLGEMNAEQLWDTTMDPETRVLMQVSIEDAAEADRMVTMLMGDEVEARKAYISKHADFNKETDKNFEKYL